MTPADTRMMGIVHDALRRDIDRAIVVLASRPEGPRANAVAEHVPWMMRFLHEHHVGEDTALWPLVREREPRAAGLLDAMEADHAAIAPRVEACAKAEGAALQDALEQLRGVLFPHLRREEDEVMPIVSVSITDAEWHAIDQEHFVKPKSLSELGLEGHWLLDGLDPERTLVVLHQVAFLPRLVLRYGFARRYRHRATACWGQGDYGPQRPDRRIARTSQVSTVVPTPVEAVWAVAADVTRVGEWSHECGRVEWLEGATAARPGVRFQGTNRAGPWTWTRLNEVLAADPPHRLVWRTVPTRLFPDSTEWCIELDEVEGGTRITQSFRALRAPAVLVAVYAVLVPSHRRRTTGLEDDLRRLGELAALRPATAP